MIIDFHTHIFPKVIREQRERYFNAEPNFECLYASPKSKMVGADALVATMNEQNIDKSVVFGFPWRKEKTFRLHNDYILESLARYSDRLIGFCCLDPFNSNAPTETERCLNAGLAGVGELAFYQNGIDNQCLEHLDPIMALCHQFNVPILIHTNEPIGHPYPGKSPNTLAQIYALAKRFRQNRIILAHWGGGIFLYHLLKKDVAQTLANVWYDTAASPFLYQPQIYRNAIDLISIEKILFGSDFPLLKPQRYFKEMQTANLSKKAMRRICGDNARDILIPYKFK